MPVFVANTNVLELLGLKNEISGAFINTATVTVTVKDKDTLAAVTGMTWPAPMPNVAASQGDYRLILEDDLALIAKKNYIAFIDADNGPNEKGHWEFPFKPETRTGVA